MLSWLRQAIGVVWDQFAHLQITRRCPKCKMAGYAFTLTMLHSICALLSGSPYRFVIRRHHLAGGNNSSLTFYTVEMVVRVTVSSDDHGASYTEYSQCDHGVWGPCLYVDENNHLKAFGLDRTTLPMVRYFATEREAARYATRLKTGFAEGKMIWILGLFVFLVTIAQLVLEVVQSMRAT